MIGTLAVRMGAHPVYESDFHGFVPPPPRPFVVLFFLITLSITCFKNLAAVFLGGSHVGSLLGVGLPERD